MRGVIPATILRFIEGYTGKRIWELFDICAGVSTGGLLVSALTKPFPLTAAQCVELYRTRGREIFPQSFRRKLKTLDGNLGPRYDGAGLRKVLEDTFGQTLLESARTPTFMPAYAIEQRCPIFFKSWNLDGKTHKLVDVCSATSAGPTYFPPAQVNGVWYCDGGVVDNNPSLSATIEACMRYGAKTHDCLVLSLGTGVCEEPIEQSAARNWGNLQWVQPLIGVFMDGVSDLTHYQLTDLLPNGQYLYLQSRISESDAAMDDTSAGQIARLEAIGENIIDSQKGPLLALLHRITK